MARDRFFQILSVIRFDDKTTSNQQKSTDKLAPIRNVFESIISTFQMAYTPNEHITTDEQLVMGSNYEVLLMQRIFMPATCKYILARVVK